MDMYIILCFFPVFAALVEFACINFDGTLQLQFEIELLEEEVLADRDIVKDLDCKMDNVTENVNFLDGRIAQQETTVKKTKNEMESLKSEREKMQALFQKQFTCKPTYQPTYQPTWKPTNQPTSLLRL